MKINWRVRLKNRVFWLSAIPAAMMLAETLAAVFGITLDLGDLGNKLIAVVEAGFVLLTVLGIVTDHTTKGFSDSAQALTYAKPKE